MILKQLQAADKHCTKVFSEVGSTLCPRYLAALDTWYELLKQARVEGIIRPWEFGNEPEYLP